MLKSYSPIGSQLSEVSRRTPPPTQSRTNLRPDGVPIEFQKNYGATACRKDTKTKIKASKCGRLIPCYPVPPCNPRYDYIVKYPSWYPPASRKREGTWNCRDNP